MEINTKENQNTKDNNDQPELIIKEIEINFDELLKVIPEEIKEEIQLLINKFTTIIKEQESHQLSKGYVFPFRRSCHIARCYPFEEKESY